MHGIFRCRHTAWDAWNELLAGASRPGGRKEVSGWFLAFWLAVGRDGGRCSRLLLFCDWREIQKWVGPIWMWMQCTRVSTFFSPEVDEKTMKVEWVLLGISFTQVEMTWGEVYFKWNGVYVKLHTKVKMNLTRNEFHKVERVCHGMDGFFSSL